MNLFSDVLLLNLELDIEQYNPVSQKDILACNLLKSNLLKKLVTSRNELTAQKAVNTFLSMNDKCAHEFSIWDYDELTVRIISEARHDLYNDFCHTLPSALHLYENMDFGPGASVRADGSSFYEKILSNVKTSTSNELIADYKHALVLKPRWSQFNDQLPCEYKLIPGNSLSVVPKNDETDRVICTEPLLNMFYQKGLESYLRRLLSKYHNIDLATQAEHNKILARIGSIDGSLSTIDLKSASDTISVSFCKYFLPDLLFKLLDHCRSPFTRLPNGEWVELNMISSMGNATTFPLQTLIFSCLARAAIRIMGNHGADNRYGVFGDDIIIPTGIFMPFCKTLTSCGFIVNDTKSFSTGNFRESCGGDFYAGFDVRAVYCRSLENPHDVYSLINRLNLWSAKLKILLPNTVQYLLSAVRPIFIPLYEDDSHGIKVPRSVVHDDKYRSYSQYVRSLDLRDPAFLPVKFRYNASAALIAMLKGTLFGGCLILRNTKKRSRYIRKVCPNWDTPNVASILSSKDVLAWWKYTTCVNLNLAG